MLYETAAFNSGFTAKDPNKFVKRFYNIYSKAMGVLSLERNEIEVEDIELEAGDYENENEEQVSFTPDVQVQDLDE